MSSFIGRTAGRTNRRAVRSRISRRLCISPCTWKPVLYIFYLPTIYGNEGGGEIWFPAAPIRFQHYYGSNKGTSVRRGTTMEVSYRQRAISLSCWALISSNTSIQENMAGYVGVLCIIGRPVMRTDNAAQIGLARAYNLKLIPTNWINSAPFCVRFPRQVVSWVGPRINHQYLYTIARCAPSWGLYSKVDNRYNVMHTRGVPRCTPLSPGETDYSNSRRASPQQTIISSTSQTLEEKTRFMSVTVGHPWTTPVGAISLRDSPVLLYQQCFALMRGCPTEEKLDPSKVRKGRE